MGNEDSIAGIVEGYRSGAFSPASVVRDSLDRIEAADGELHCFTHVCTAEVVEMAAASSERYSTQRPIGPLDGVVFAAKDVFDTAGVVTAGNSRAFAARVPSRDAVAILRLKSAGALLIGKTNLYELGSGAPEEGLVRPTKNPWNTAHVPGGSSSGSAAAVASGMSAFALGTDTGGSVRIPASHCGVVGLKPTAGVISRTGVLPLSPTLDHVGILSRSGRDAWEILLELQGYDVSDPESVAPPSLPPFPASPTRLRIGIPMSYALRAPSMRPVVLTAYRRAARILRDLGHTVTEVDFPEHGKIFPVAETISKAEAFAVHRTHLKNHASDYGSAFRQYLSLGALIRTSDYVDAQHGRHLLHQWVARLLESVDIVATPTVSAPAPLIHSTETNSTKTYFTRLFNLTGHPAVSVPMGYTRSRLPLGLQIVGSMFEDCQILSVADAFAGALDLKTKNVPWRDGLHGNSKTTQKGALT